MTQAGWDDELNARMYDEYTQRFPTYQEGSARLVARAQVGRGDRVLDLACGTGATTAEVLKALGSTGSVVAVDRSAAMSSLARRRIDDARVKWVLAAAEDLAVAVTGQFDGIICHGAIWHMDMASVTPQLHAALKPGGRLVCNTTAEPASRPATARTKPGLYDLMRAYAVIDHDFVFRRAAAKPPMSASTIVESLQDNGFAVETEEYDGTVKQPEAFYAWMRIPVFTEHWTGLTYEQRMDALDKAWARFEPPTDQPRTTRELLITARRATA